MKPDPAAARQLVQNAQRALQMGNRPAARRWAEKAAALAPGWEEPWLILASLASPRASVAYLQQALQINPHSERARQGMHWAAKRLRSEQAEGQTRPQRAHQASATRSEPKTRPRVERPAAPTLASSAPTNRHLSTQALARPRWSFLPLIVLLICGALGWAFWPGNASPALAFLGFSQDSPSMGVSAWLNKPTYTPTFTATFTPTPTYTPTPTPTATPTFTPTSTPTDTPTPTWTPTPTFTPLPTDTPIPWPTATPIPYSGGGGTRWIDVDLSEQRLYAYEGSTIVASFLVSTGVPAYPTVTGKYYIYMKLVSTTMSGPGYYLPNVPYTMYFYKGYGIHGTYWHNNFGHPMSHGCVNMATPDAQWLFYWASEGTLVNIHY